MRIYSVDPPCHPSSNAYRRCCSCRSKPNENSQFPQTINRWFYKRQWDETLKRLITKPKGRISFPDREKSSIGTKVYSDEAKKIPKTRKIWWLSFTCICVAPSLVSFSSLRSVVFACLHRVFTAAVCGSVTLQKASNGGCFIIINWTREKGEKRSI